MDQHISIQFVETFAGENAKIRFVTVNECVISITVYFQLLGYSISRKVSSILFFNRACLRQTADLDLWRTPEQAFEENWLELVVDKDVGFSPWQC